MGDDERKRSPTPTPDALPEPNEAQAAAEAVAQTGKTPSKPAIKVTDDVDLTEDAVYFEDLPMGSSQKSTSSNPSKSPSTPKKAPKRQLNLTDMFTPVAKKPRVAASSSQESPASGPSGSARTASSATPTRRVNGLMPLNSIPFSLGDYRANLSEREKELLSLECDTMGPSWLKVLKDEIRNPYFLKLKEFLAGEGVTVSAEQSSKSPRVFPPPKDIYNWSRVTPLGRIKVVIIGQDPYHGPGQAHGLCFSVKKGVAVPPSLRNMYKEIKNDYPDFVAPKHGDLSSWAQNGVLLINTSLTVRAGDAASHSGKGWETFTDAVIDLVDKYGGASLTKAQGGIGRGVVFIAWGAHAAKRVVRLSKTKHLVLSSAHPSPLSASRGFFGNAHFKKANDWLETKYGAEAKVDWCRLD